jgi:hypothetical protein
MPVTPRYSPRVHMIKLTQQREIAPYKWVHPDDDERRWKVRKSRQYPDQRLRELRKPTDRLRRTLRPFLRCQRSPARLDCSRVALRSSQCRSRHWYLVPRFETISCQPKMVASLFQNCFIDLQPRLRLWPPSPWRPAVNFRHNGCSAPLTAPRPGANHGAVCSRN